MSADLKILVVDDFAAWREAMRRSLKDLGYADVVLASHGDDALLKLREERDVALVISDWNMDPMDGLELLRTMKRDPALRPIPFILVTAEGGSIIESEARADGASGFMRKPFTTEKLGLAVAAALRGDGF